MHPRSARDCYCKSCVPTEDPMNEIQTDRSRVRLLTSKVSVHKTGEAVRDEKKVPTSARLVDEDQPATKRSTAALPVSPVLSPETSAVLENVERLVKDAEIQMKEISMITNCNRTQTPIKVYSNEAPLDDQTDQLLYVRERVAHKFQEANGWIVTDHAGIKNQGYMTSATVPLKLTRTIDFSAPRFKSSEERYKELSRYGKLGIQKLGPSVPVADVPETKENSRNRNEAGPSSLEAEKNKKIDTFSVQAGPSVNIRRELVAQSLGDIHISPDPSFVPESTNVGTYMVRRDCPVKPSSPTRKEKFVQISEKTASAKGSRRAMSGRQRARDWKVSSEPASNVEKKPVEKAVKGPDRSSDIALKSNERPIETVEKLREKEAEAMSPEDKENLASTTSSDRRLEADLTVQPSIHGSLATEQEAGSVAGGINDSLKKSSEPRNDQKQVRFKDKEAAANLEENPKATSESLLHIPSTSKETGARRADAPPLRQGAEEKQKRRQQKNGEKEEQERNRRYRAIDERFSTVFKQYCSQDEQCLKNGAYSAVPSAESSEDAEESKDLEDLYDPSINDLDTVLLAYSKTINDVVRSTRTIEKLLLKPEIEEYRLQNRATTDTSESCGATALNESAVEVATTNVSRHSRAKRCTGPRAKDLARKDRFLLANKTANKELHSQKVTQTKTAKPAPTKPPLRAKGDDDRRKRHVAPRTLGKCPPRGGPRVKGRFSAPKKLLDEETTESSESGSIKARRALEFEEFRSRRGNDSSSLTTLSINTSSTADGRVRSAEAVARPFIGGVAEEITNAKPATTSTKEIEVEDLQKRRFDYASLYNMVHSDVLKRGFPRLKDTPSIAEHLIARVLKEETRLVEDKIRNSFNANQIVPVLVNGLLESLQSEALNPRSQSLELLISENVSANDAASANIHAVEAASARSGNQSPKENLQIKYPSGNENFSAPRPIDRDEKIVDGKACGGPNEDDIHAETVDNRESQQPPIGDENVSLRSRRDLSLDGRSEIDCGVESSKDGLSRRNDGIDPDGNVRSVVRQKCRLNKDLKVQGNDNSSSRRDCLRLVNEENETASAVQKDTLQNVRKDANCALEAVDEPLTTGRNEEDKCASCKDSAASNQDLSPPNDVVSKVKEGEAPVRYNLPEDEAETVAQSSNNVHQMSSSDSLHNCASLQSSPRNISKQSPNVGGPSFQINEMEQFSERNNVVDGGVDGPGDRPGSFRDSVFNREKILAGLYEDVHRKVLLSTFDEDHSSTGDQNGRLSKSISTIGSNKIKALSDTSHSEGELYMPSSGSYSLGEVRMLRKNRSDGEDTNGCDDSVTIFLTKKMLTSWNESSKSLIQSMGEI